MTEGFWKMDPDKKHLRNKRLIRFAVMFYVIFITNAASIAAERSILEQFDKLIQNSEGSIDTTFLSRSARLVGAALIFGGIKEFGGRIDFEAWTKDCYEKAKTSSQMRNFMACFVAVSTVADQLFKLKGGPNLRDYSPLMLFKSFWDSGIKDENAIAQAILEFLETYKSTNEWISKLTVKQVGNCLDHGLGSKECPN